MSTNTRFDSLIAQGLAASQEHRTDSALDCFLRASSLQPDAAIPHFLIGSEHAATGQAEEAEAAFAVSVLRAPGFHLARYQLGLVQFSSGRPALGLLTWEPLRQLPPSEPLRHFVEGFACLAADRLKDAERHFRSGLACPGGNTAFASDIEQVLDAITPSPTDPTGAEDATAHVLLGSYSRGSH